MASAREERLVENEELFRRANERLRERAERIVEPGQSVPFLCECIDERCMDRLDLTLEDYARVRSDGERFVIAVPHSWAFHVGKNSVRSRPAPSEMIERKR